MAPSAVTQPFCKLRLIHSMHRMGSLRSNLLVQRLLKNMPVIIQRLDEKIKEARHNENFLMRLSSEPDMRTVAKELEVLVNQLHPASDRQVKF